MRRGAINHVALTVSDLERAEAFFEPLFDFLGYYKEEALHGLSIWVSPATGTAVNLWQARAELANRPHQRYAPGLHHLAFHADSRGQVDSFHELLVAKGVTVLDPPAEYDYAPGYYAVFFEGPDGMKFELVYLAALVR